VHVALVRSGGTLTLYGNGVSQGSVSHSVNLTSTDINIGSNRSGASVFNGYISDLRVVNDTVYTGDFTPPTSRLTAIADTVLLTCNLPYLQSGLTVTGDVSMAANSPYETADYQASLHGGSYVFDGNGDHLDVSGSSSLEFGSADFTIELWLNINSVGLYAITDPRTSGSSLSPLIWTKSTGELYYYTAGGDRIVGSTQLNANIWYHVALTKYNGTTTLYLNGSSEGSFSDSYTYEQPTNFRIGRRYIPNDSNNSFDLDGKISDLRIVKGTAVYTENFTVPSAPLAGASPAPAPAPAPEPELPVNVMLDGDDLFGYGWNSWTNNPTNHPSEDSPSIRSIVPEGLRIQAPYYSWGTWASNTYPDQLAIGQEVKISVSWSNLDNDGRIELDAIPTGVVDPNLSSSSMQRIRDEGGPESGSEIVSFEISSENWHMIKASAFNTGSGTVTIEKVEIFAAG
jgi:hypothetical protein